MIIILTTLLILSLIQNKGEKLTCIHFKNNRTPIANLPQTYDRINVVDLTFDCNYTILLKHGCLTNITNHSVHYFDRFKGPNLSLLEPFLYYLRDNNRKIQEEQTRLIQGIFSDLKHRILTNRAFIQKNIYKAGKLIVPAKRDAITKYKLHKKNVIKKKNDINFALILPLNKLESLYYSYSIIQNKIDFQLVEFTILYNYSFICRPDIKQNKVLKKMDKLISVVKTNVTTKDEQPQFYLADLAVLTNYCTQMKKLNEESTLYINIGNISSNLCDDSMFISPSTGMFFINKYKNLENKCKSINHVNFKYIRLEDK